MFLLYVDIAQNEDTEKLRFKNIAPAQRQPRYSCNSRGFLSCFFRSRYVRSQVKFHFSGKFHKTVLQIQGTPCRRCIQIQLPAPRFPCRFNQLVKQKFCRPAMPPRRTREHIGDVSMASAGIVIRRRVNLDGHSGTSGGRFSFPREKCDKGTVRQVSPKEIQVAFQKFRL